MPASGLLDLRPSVEEKPVQKTPLFDEGIQVYSQRGPMMKMNERDRLFLGAEKKTWTPRVCEISWPFWPRFRGIGPLRYILLGGSRRKQPLEPQRLWVRGLHSCPSFGGSVDH